MAALLELLEARINDDVLRKLSRQIDADVTSTRHAVSAALPLLIGSLAREANESQTRARTLNTSLERNHDGSLLENLGPLLDRSGGGHAVTDAGSGFPGGYTIDRCAADGDGVLRYVLDDRRAAVENGISRACGLDVSRVALLLPILATIVMSALGRLKRERDLDEDGLARMLNRERVDVEKKTPEVKRDRLLGFLELSDDRKIIEEVARIGSVFCGKVPAAAGPSE